MPSDYSAIHPRETLEYFPYRSSMSWSSDQQTMHMGTVLHLPTDCNTPRPRGTPRSWRYTTDHGPPGLLVPDVPGENAIPLGYTD
eukprot:scaffold12077_cov57-Attheya_sp.AAC.4